jgi:hypothetical protein
MKAKHFGGRRSLILGAAVAVWLGHVAQAQDQPTPNQPAPNDAINSMIGSWELSNADHDKTCRLSFRSDSAAGVNKLDVDKNCAMLFPSTKDAVGWQIDRFGTLKLFDARGNVVTELTEAEAGIFDGFQEGEGRYVLQSAAAAPVRSADDLVGDWGVARSTGKPICVLTLSNSPADAESLVLKVKPGCDPFVTRFGPASWRIDQGELILLSARGQKWRFEEDDPNTWLRVPEGADPILLVRQ